MLHGIPGTGRRDAVHKQSAEPETRPQQRFCNSEQGVKLYGR